MCIFGSLGKEPPKKSEHVFALDDKERSGSGFWVFGRDLIAGTYCAFGHACLPCGLCFGSHRDRNITLKFARRITEALAEAFPDDPYLVNFALFGSGERSIVALLPVNFLYPSAP